MSMIRVSTKQTITPRATSQTIDVQYPIHWFRDHPNSKPILSITLICDNLETARQMLRKGISDNNINLDVAKSFLYYFGLTIKAKSTDEWKSYDRVICEAGAEISPLNLVRVESNVAKIEFQTSVYICLCSR